MNNFFEEYHKTAFEKSFYLVTVRASKRTSSMYVFSFKKPKLLYYCQAAVYHCTSVTQLSRDFRHLSIKEFKTC